MSRRTRLTRLAVVLALSLSAAGPAVAARPAAAVPPVESAAAETDLERGPETTGRPRPVGQAASLAQGTDAGTSGGDAESTLRARLTLRSDALDPTFSGQVSEVSSGRLVWSRNRTTTGRPASAMKVVTAVIALRTLGPDHTYRTRVYRKKGSPTALYLQGSGDPTLSSARLRAVADRVAADSRRRGISRVTLRYDDYLFPAPTNAVGWEATDVPRWVAPVRALVRDQRNVADTSADAATYVASRLKVRGLVVTSVRRGPVPSGRDLVASTVSPRLRVIVADMLRVSQNDYAEALLWTAGIHAGSPRTWAGVTTHARTSLAAYGVPTDRMVLRDGSGLSRSTRLSAYHLATLMGRVARDPVLRPIFVGREALPRAGQTGTLENRFVTRPTTCAVGRVKAKTGSMRDASTLVGLAAGVDGKERAFAFVSNGRASSTDVRWRIDRLAATSTMCI